LVFSDFDERPDWMRSIRMFWGQGGGETSFHAEPNQERQNNDQAHRDVALAGARARQ
jgi:hypothetical protein